MHTQCERAVADESNNRVASRSRRSAGQPDRICQDRLRPRLSGSALRRDARLQPVQAKKQVLASMAAGVRRLAPASKWYLVAACLFLSACGGGGGSTSVPIATPAAPVAPAQQPSVTQLAAAAPIVEMYGDSTTKGQETINGQPYFTQFNEPWQVYTRFTQGGIAAQVGNEGLSGTRAYQMLNGLAPFTTPWSGIMAISPAKVVTVNFGMNDSVDPTETSSQFEQNLVQIVKIAQSYGKTVLLETPNQSCEPTHAAALPAYVAAILEAGQQTDAVVIDHFDEEVGTDWQANLTDCIHPDDTLYGYKGSIAYPYIKNALAAT